MHPSAWGLLMSEDRKEFARYMWVLKFHSDWCAHLPHYTYNTTKVLGIDSRLEHSPFLLRYFICSVNSEEELQLACIFILLLLYFVILFLCRSFFVFVCLLFYYMIYMCITVQIQHSAVDEVEFLWQFTINMQPDKHTTENTTRCGTTGGSREIRPNGQKFKKRGGNLVFV